MALPADIKLVDLRHLGREHVIGAWIVGDVIVDPGPSTCLETLLEGLGDRVPRALALTHIHLDHAGASGLLARRFPDLEVWVHERGAPHMADPARLLASARRLYGDAMDRLWGEVVGVPADRIRALSGSGELGPFEFAHTPGHASHHVAYRHRESSLAFCGDVAGVRIDGGYVLPPTPPPDIDLAAWRQSLALLERWEPARLCLTHFGSYENAGEHLRAMGVALDEVERMASDLDEASFVASMRARISDAVDPGTAESYWQAMPPDQCFAGLVRYLRTRGEGD